MNAKTPLNSLRDLPLRLSWATVALCFCLTAHRAGATLYYVNDVDTANDIYCTAPGLDSNDGLTPASPVASLGTILERYTLGFSDTVYVDAGTYRSSSNIVIDSRHGGSWDGTLTIQGAGRTTVFDRGSRTKGDCCLMNLANHIRIQGLTFTGADVGLSIDASLCSYAEIAGNTFFDNIGAAIVVQPSTSTFYGSFMIAHNLLYNNGGGLCLEPQVEVMGDSFKVVNNTVLVTNGVAVLVGGNLPNSQVCNNILVATSGGICFETVTGGSLFLSDYNDLWAHDGGVVGRMNANGTSVTMATLADWQRFTQTNNASARDTHSIGRDPAFADAANADFHLKSFGGRWLPSPGEWIIDFDTHSPCVDAADPYIFTDDLSFEPEPNGGRKNMGADGGTSQASKASMYRALLAMAPDLGQDPLQTQPILWSATGQGWEPNATVHLDYSLDSGTTWQTITNAQWLSVANGSFDWSRPSETFNPNGCWVRVVSDADPACMDAALLPFLSATSTQFYVNDDSLLGDVWCTATGLDTNDGLTPATPMATVQAVIDRYHPAIGATIRVDAGNYLLSSDIVLPDTGAGGGSSPAWLCLIGTGRNTVLNRQSTASDTCCLRVYQDFTYIEGFVFKGADVGVTVYPDSCRNAKVVGSIFAGNSSCGLRVIPDTTSEGFDTYQIYNNLIYGTVNGMSLQAESGNHLATCYVKNNTVAVYGGVGIACGGRPSGTFLSNNIVSAKGSGFCLSVDTSGALYASDYNDFYAYGGAGIARWSTSTAAVLSASLLSAWQSASGKDASSFSRNPLFVAPASDDFHLRSQGGSWHNGAWTADTATSPCIDAGNPSDAFGQEPANNGGRINMGAFGNTSEASKSAPKRALYLNSPRGGETWSGTQTIIWSSSGTGWNANDSVRIEVSTDGNTWTVLPGAASLTPSGSFTWPIPIPSTGSASYRLRVVCNQDSAVYDATESVVIVKRLMATYFVNDLQTSGDEFCTAPGADTNSGTSPASPLLSLSDVLQRYTLGPGDTVYVDAGTYLLSSNVVIDASHVGSADAPIRVVGTRTGTVLNRQTIGTDRRCLELHADYLRIEGLICSFADIGIAVDASTARHVQLVANTCRNNTSYGITVKPFGVKPGEEYQILQNVLCNNGAGMYLQGGPNSSDSRTVFVVENNSLINGGCGITILNANRPGRRTNLLKNNLIHVTGAKAACIVALPGALHYSDFNDLFAVRSDAFVGALVMSSSGATTTNSFASLADWRSVNGQDTHSMAVDGKFVSPVNGNLRLRPDSPCVDAGVNSFWMFDNPDADGHVRISGNTCDIGAYELNMTTLIRLFLQGPFLSGLSLMTSELSQVLPLKSPYADDTRTATNLPNNVTDWVLVQFRKETNGPAILSRSVFLRNDGWLVNDKGEPDLDVDLPPNGSYYLVVKHRNHLAAMSSVPLAYTNQSLTYDFTASDSAYFGGTNGCVAVSGGNTTFWALRSGDSDGDGRVLPVDATICASQTNALGYRRADADLDGIVTTTDDSRILQNLFATSAVPRPEVVLQPTLRLTPARLTLTEGETVTLTGYDDTRSNTATSGITNTTIGVTGIVGDGTLSTTTASLNWAFAQNASSGTLQTTGLAQAVYTAGPVTGSTDIVEAWNSNDTLGRAYLNVIATQTVAAVGKTLIIAGRKSADDTLWPTTDYLADSAYLTLRYRGFSKENTFYLNPEPGQDVDGNGEFDDIDAVSTTNNAAYAMTNSLANSDQVFIYLVDHGGNSSGNGYFRLSASETITATQLDAWLDTLQDTYNTKVTVLLDFCYAGSFLHALTYTGAAPRIVVAACDTNQPSYFVAGGLVSFSSAFFSGVLLGYDVGQCFDLAKGAMSTYQAAQLDDDKDGVYTTNDWAVADGTYIGPTSVASGDAPVIGQVCGNQVLSSETSATLWIGSVSSLHPITRAWCLIVPPGYDPNPDNPVTELPTLELTFDDASGRYSVTYDGFTTPGTYSVQFYVQDDEGNVSAPRQAFIAQIGYDDRVILVAGGDTNGTAWPSIEYLTQLAYATLRLRLFSPDHIRLLSSAPDQDLDGDGTNDVAAVSGLASLQDAIAAWATTNSTDRLTLYLIGDGYQNTFRLNDTECLTTNELAEWVHTFQATNPVPVNIVLDFSGAGAFLPALSDTALAAESPDATRIAIASSTAGGEALFSNGGTVSFSQYLLSSLATGETLGDAYTAARRAIRRVSGSVRQRAQIDDTLNGVANEKDIDGLLAGVTYLGSAFVTGSDAPVIGEVSGPTALTSAGAPVTLWAQNVAGMNPISNVWCVITPPGFDGTAALPAYELAWNAAASRYELLCESFVAPGTYTLTFYAQDTIGEISDPVQSEIILADAYEPDDTQSQAFLYDGQVQIHNFHTATDVDWVYFYLVPDFIYDFETYHHSEMLDTVLDLYRQLPDGTLELLDHVDEEGSDMGEYTGMDHPASGWYWAKISPYEGSTNATVGTYEFSVEIPAAAGTTSLIVLGLDDVVSGALPSNSTATVSGQGTQTFNGSTSVVFSGLTNGTYLVSVPAPTYFFPREDPNTPYQVPSLTNLYYANPRQVTVSGGWRMAGFEMIPSVTATSGIVRDAWTHALLENAQISFTATSGSLTGTVVDGSVILTNYRTNWLSAANGQMPPTIVLGACKWDLSVSLSGYLTNLQCNAISNAPAGSSVALGTAFLVPIDANSNAVADAWESQYFPGGMVATEDTDADGLDNRQEYLCGTDPTNALSVLRFIASSVETNTPTLTWSVVGGRGYQILAATSLLNFASAVTNGPWEASYGQSNMQWSDTNAVVHPARFYRVRLNTP